MSRVLDLVTLCILGICTWNGYRKGFVMSLAGVLTLVIAVLVGGYVARNYTPQIAEALEPYIGWLSTDTDATDEALAAADEESVETISAVFESLGVSGDAAMKLAEKADALIEEKNLSIKNGISSVFTETLTYILVFIVVFALVALILTVIANMISTAFGLPVLNALNKFGGIALGAVYGLLIIFAATWLLRFTGVLVPQETLENTWFVRLFMQINPVKLMLGM